MVLKFESVNGMLHVMKRDSDNYCKSDINDIEVRERAWYAACYEGVYHPWCNSLQK
jgi:hypothetical protein